METTESAVNTGVNSLSYSIAGRGVGGCCDKYNVDAFQMNGVNIAFRFARWDDASRKYYIIPVSVKNQPAVMAAFPGLNIEEDEPGAVLLRGCDDETAAKVGNYAAVLDGELQETTATDTASNVTTAITNELNARKDKSAWSKAVTSYALELVETLDNWDKQPESVAELREMMLNGASDWGACSWGGSSLIYNQDIAERCCTPSELKRATNKNGLRDMANAHEHWLDVQARALAVGGRKYTAKWFGGGFVFTSYNIADTLRAALNHRFK